MSDKTNLYTFPSDQDEALAMLLLQNQDLSKTSPEDVCDRYWEYFYRIRSRRANARASAKARFYDQEA